ncbi:MAG: hypothetical protein WC023_09795 [Rhodocyclaceae bacterium]
MPHEKAVSIISEGKGTHFAPDMVDAFIEIQENFRAVSKHYADSDIDMEKKKEQLERLAGSGA